MLQAKDIKKFIAKVPDDAYVTIRDGYITCVSNDHIVSLNQVGAEWRDDVCYHSDTAICKECPHVGGPKCGNEEAKYTNIKTTEEECLNELKNVGITADEACLTLGDRIEEMNSNFARSLAEIGIDIEGKDLLEIIAEIADKIKQLQIELDQTRHDLRKEMLFI